MNVAKDLGALWLPSEEEGIAAVAGGDSKPILPFTPVSSVGQGWRWPQVDPAVLGSAWAASAVALLVVGYLFGGQLNTGSLKKQLSLAQQGGQQEKSAREQAESELKKLVTQQTQGAWERQKLEDENERLTAELATAQELQKKATVAMEEMEQKLAMRAAAPPVAPPAAPPPAAPLPAGSIPAETQPNGIGMEMKLIPAGKFQMGEVGSAVAVTLTRPFWLGKTEVTQGQWEQVMGTKPWSGSGGKSAADLPATNVNWTDATEFCKKLTQRERGTGKLPANEEYRLPTEAEWEYACRAGTTTKYSFGDDESKLGDFAWFSGNSGNAAHKVGTKQANPWGLYDMHGNIWEWCSDWYDGKLAGGADPAGPGGGSNRVHRGGSWRNGPVYCRSANRSFFVPSHRIDCLGFRVARSQSAPVAERPVKLETNSVGIALLEIPAGKFQMGEGDRAVAVTLSRPFWLGKTEVTQGQWQKVMGIRPGDQAVGKSDADLPALNVNWNEVTAFCKKLTQRERGNGTLPANEEYRLPTEAEWEYACRAGTTTKYSFGDDESKLGDFAWFSGNSGNAVHQVGTKQANPWGLDDMHGNVWEWCSDWYDGKLAGGADPVGPGGGSIRVIRGGSWGYSPVFCRSAYRGYFVPSLRFDFLGFRVARSQSVQ